MTICDEIDDGDEPCVLCHCDALSSPCSTPNPIDGDLLRLARANDRPSANDDVAIAIATAIVVGSLAR